jgi:hypothetical protein
MSVSLDDVRGAYRFILGREPESNEVAERHQLEAASFEALRLAFFSSEEFRAQAFPDHPSRQMVSLVVPPQAVETAADPTSLQAIIAKIAVAWEAIGDTAPHYSVLTQEDYIPESLQTRTPSSRVGRVTSPFCWRGRAFLSVPVPTADVGRRYPKRPLRRRSRLVEPSPGQLRSQIPGSD